MMSHRLVVIAADAVAALFADDAVVHVADMPAIDGRDAIRRFYGNLFGFLVATRATPEAGEWRIAAYSVSSDAPPESEARDGGGGHE